MFACLSCFSLFCGIAAVGFYVGKFQDHGVVKSVETTKPQYRSLSSARSFVAAVFSLPASLMHPHPNKEVILNGVLFPITGFHFVSDKPDHCRALSSVCNPSCRLPAANEAVYGWYSPACHLNQFSDEKSYAAHPVRIKN